MQDGEVVKIVQVLVLDSVVLAVVLVARIHALLVVVAHVVKVVALQLMAHQINF